MWSHGLLHSSVDIHEVLPVMGVQSGRYFSNLQFRGFTATDVQSSIIALRKYADHDRYTTRLSLDSALLAKGGEVYRARNTKLKRDVANQDLTEGVFA